MHVANKTDRKFHTTIPSNARSCEEKTPCSSDILLYF